MMKEEKTLTYDYKNKVCNRWIYF